MNWTWYSWIFPDAGQHVDVGKVAKLMDPGRRWNQSWERMGYPLVPSAPSGEGWELQPQPSEVYLLWSLDRDAMI